MLPPSGLIPAKSEHSESNRPLMSGRYFIFQLRMDYVETIKESEIRQHRFQKSPRGDYNTNGKPPNLSR